MGNKLLYVKKEWSWAITGYNKDDLFGKSLKNEDLPYRSYNFYF